MTTYRVTTTPQNIKFVDNPSFLQQRVMNWFFNMSCRQDKVLLWNEQTNNGEIILYIGTGLRDNGTRLFDEGLLL